MLSTRSLRWIVALSAMLVGPRAGGSEEQTTAARPDVSAASPSPSSGTVTQPSAILENEEEQGRGISMAIEQRRDQIHYRFENPSSFDTASLVPHFFEQRYRTDNGWAVFRGQYPIGRWMCSSELGLTLSRTGSGEDYDTFYQPDGDVVRYGSAASVRVRSFRFAQRVDLASVAGFAVSVGYAYQRDSASYPPSFTTTVHTKPPSTQSFWNEARETVSSIVGVVY